MRPPILLLAAIVGLPLLAAAPAPAQTILYDKSRISSISRQMNVPVEAPFRKFTAQVAFDPAKPAAGKARIDIDVGSFDIDNAEVNDEVRGRQWFDAKTYPHATFVSSGIRPLGGGRYEARGPLTIKGKTAEVVAPFTYREDAGTGIFDGVFTIRRLNYNIGEGVWKDTDTVADEVQIRFRITVALRPAARN